MSHLLLGSWGPMDKVHTGNRASETMRLKYHGDARAQTQNKALSIQQSAFSRTLVNGHRAAGSPDEMKI